MSNHIFFTVIFGFMGGVILRSFLSFGFVFTGFVFLLGITLLLLWTLQRTKNVLFVSLTILSVALGILRFDVADMNRGDPLLQTLVGETVSIEAVVIDEPDERENNTHLTVEFKNIFLNEEEFGVKSRAKITIDRYPVYEYGDRILVDGKLVKPKNFKNEETGKEFDYISYLWKDGIFYQMYYPKVGLISKSEGNFIKEKLFTFKHAFLRRISQVIPEPAASLLGGLVVGAKQSLGEKLLDDFRTVGIIHIVVLSGYNVTIVAEALMRFFAFLPRVLSLWLGAGSIVLFAIMTGAGATIVRASIMALLVIMARATGRTSEITRALFVAGFLMVLFNPKILIFDISFQLSFLATLGLILFPPLLEKYFHFVPSHFQLREFALATVSTQIFVLPLLLYKMGQLSLVALPVNLLVLMFIPLTMLFGFLTGMAGFLSIALSVPFAFITYALLAYELKVVEIFSALPFASVQIESFPIWLMLGMYGLYVWIIYKFWNKNKTKNMTTSTYPT
jgi:competence protein ComEC